MSQLHEYVGNMHMHTPYSDGESYHTEISSAASRAGLNFIIVTDHNVHVAGVEGYYGALTKNKVLLLVGEEVHDMRRNPQANHMLIYGAERELAPYAANPQNLIEEAKSSDGFCFLAHPNDVESELFHEPGLAWVDWDIEGYIGIELWNYMSEFKSYLSNKATALYYAYNPEQAITGPPPETLALWDQLLAEGRRVQIIGGSDAHGTSYSMGPLKRVIFPYEYLFRCINTHILTSRPFNGDFQHDKELTLKALKNGHAFVAYDLPASTRGFRFSAQGKNSRVTMGDRIRIGHGVTLQIVIPRLAETRLIKDGEVILHQTDGTHHTYITNETGVYRVEVYIKFKGKRRGWIFSNPIYVVA